MTPRQAAVLSLNTSIKNDKFVNIELSTAINKYKFTGLDKSFYTALFYGTVERLITLDHIIAYLSDIPFEKLEPMVLCILRTGLYQLLYMDKVPASACCNEASEIAKSFCRKSSVAYVNAMMRRAVREKESGNIKKILKGKNKLESLSLETSIPLEIIESFAKDYGEEKAQSIARHYATVKPSYTLRVNNLKITPLLLSTRIGPISRICDLYENAIEIVGSVPVEELHGFADGYFFVQDTSSQLCASLFSKKELGSSPEILDACACPGGKSFSIAINFEDKAKIVSCDLHDNRLKLVKSGAQRLSLTSVETLCKDARTDKEEFRGSFDAVLCDVPCSGLGVIAKKPDIRYKSLEETKRLPGVQSEILQTNSAFVKQGGMLVYSTCTLKRAENEEVVENFLKSNPDFKLESTDLLGKDNGMLTFFPDEHGTDGFFVAKMRKVGTKDE